MRFNFSRYGLTGGEKVLQRIFEIIPGLTSWTVLIGMIILSFTSPLIAVVIIIAFDLYWLLKLLYLTFFLVVSYIRLSIEKETDWMSRINALKDSTKPVTSKNKFSHLIYEGQLKNLIRKKGSYPSMDEIYQLVIIPIAKEAQDVVEPGIKSIINGTYPSKKIIVVLALECRAPEDSKKGMSSLKDRYKDNFFDFLISIHKDNVAGESRVKGANATHAATEAAEYLKEKGIPFENVIVSCFDSDTVVSNKYFSCLTYNFIVCPERDRASFQPIPVFYNNIWDVPGFARVLETGSSFFQLIEATNTEKLVTFSSHSMSFKALVEVGYWPVDMISDDSAIFWKAYLHFDSKYKVVPMYTTVSMDIVAANSWWRTIVNEYKQKRRWAWGVENFPIVMRGFLKNKNITFYNKFRLAFKLFEGHIAWATWAFLLTIIGWLPVFFAGRHFQTSVLYYSEPRIAGIIFNLAFFSLATSIILSLCLLPRDKVKNPILKRALLAFQWLFIPLIILFLSALPALDAQTRLMLGKRMEFWVADKKSKT